MAAQLSPFNQPRHDPIQTRNVSAAIVAVGLHLFVAYLALTIQFTRGALEREKSAELTWITLAVPKQSAPDEQPVPESNPAAPRLGNTTLHSPPTLAPSQAKPSTAITQPATPGLEVLSAYVACGLTGVDGKTIEDREKCDEIRAAFGDGKPEEFVQTDEERALWAKFAQDKTVQEAGVFSVCSNRGGVTIALTIRLIGGELFIGDASNAKRKADTNMLDDSNMPGMPQFGCDTPEGALFKPWLR